MSDILIMQKRHKAQFKMKILEILFKILCVCAFGTVPTLINLFTRRRQAIRMPAGGQNQSSERTDIMKKLLAALSMLTVLSATGLSQLAAPAAADTDAPTGTAYQKTGNLTVDGDLADWAEIPKTYLSYYDVKDGVMDTEAKTSQDSYFQLQYDGEKVYLAAAFADSTDSKTFASDLDWCKFMFDFGTVEGSEYNAWTSGIISAEQATGNLWGENSQIQNHDWVQPENEREPGGLLFENHASQQFKMVYDAENGFRYVEMALLLKGELKDRLVKDGTFQFDIHYDDHVTSHDQPDSTTTRRYFWANDAGSLAAAHKQADETFGTITMGGTPESEAPGDNPTASALKMTGEFKMDADIAEWKDVPKTYLPYQNFADGAADGEGAVSQDSYFQVVYDENNLYFAGVFADEALDITDGNPGRDWCKLAFDLDGVSQMHEDPNTRAMCVVAIGGDGWHPKDGSTPHNWEGYDNRNNGLAFQSSDMRIRWADGMSYVEGCFELNDDLKERLKAGTVFGLGVKYEDHLAKHDDHDPTARRYLWGDNDYTFYDDITQFGLLTLSDQTVEFKQPEQAKDPEIQEPTQGAPANKPIVRGDDGTVTASWDAMEGAAGYQVNLFSQFEGIDGSVSSFFVKTLTAEGTTVSFADLDPNSDYAYQVIALDAQGAPLAVYEAVKVPAANGGSGTGDNNGNEGGGNQEPGDNTDPDGQGDTTEPGTDEGNPKTGVGFVWPALGLVLAAGTVLAVAKRRR